MLSVIFVLQIEAEDAQEDENDIRLHVGGVDFGARAAGHPRGLRAGLADAVSLVADFSNAHRLLHICCICEDLRALGQKMGL